MVKKTITVKTKDGITYTKEITVCDTCEDYYSTGSDQSIKRKIRKIERFLDDMSYIKEHADDSACLDEYRQLAEVMRMTDEF